jgi:membrane-associated phospholipid phosphatase
MVNVGRNLNADLFDRTYSALGDPNPVAAMPSLHQAITFMLFWFARRHSWWLGSLALFYSLAMAFSLVYTGEHYVIDILVGSAMTTYAYYYSGRWLNITAPILGAATRRRSYAAAELETLPPNR